MNLRSTIYWGTVSQNSDIFFVSQIGNFPLDIGKNILFCNWEHDPKLVFKICQKTLYSLSEISRKQLHLYHYTYSRQIYIARQGIFWSKLLPDSLNRMNTHALIISKCLPDPNKYKSYVIQISYEQLPLCYECSLRRFF